MTACLQVSLKAMEVEPDNAKIEELLRDIVFQLIEECHEEHRLAPTNEMSQPLGPSPCEEREMVLPLIRLRVDYTGYNTIHSQRFGSLFVGKVANPRDIILWSKTSVRCDARSYCVLTASQMLSWHTCIVATIDGTVTWHCFLFVVSPAFSGKQGVCRGASRVTSE